jgi:hypothetical protein
MAPGLLHHASIAASSRTTSTQTAVMDMHTTFGCQTRYLHTSCQVEVHLRNCIHLMAMARRWAVPAPATMANAASTVDDRTTSRWSRYLRGSCSITKRLVQCYQSQDCIIGVDNELHGNVYGQDVQPLAFSHKSVPELLLANSLPAWAGEHQHQRRRCKACHQCGVRDEQRQGCAKEPRRQAQPQACHRDRSTHCGICL